MLYVRKEFSVERKQNFEFNNLELLWAEIKIDKQKIFLGVGYRPPGMSAIEVDEFLNLFSQSYEMALQEHSDAIIIIGDFNDKCKHWSDGHPESELGLRFFNYLNYSNLFQLIDEPTRLNSLLDLFITDSPGYIDDYGTHSPISNIDHRIIFGHLKIHNSLPAKIHRKVWHYNRANFIDINNALTDAPWDVAFNTFGADIDAILDYYYGIINRIMDEYIPSKVLIKSKHDKPWMCPYLKWLMRIRNRWNGTYDRTQNSEHKYKRDVYRRLCRREIKRHKAYYYNRLKNDLSSNQITVKRFWKIMKELYGSKVKESIPTIMDDGVAYTTDIEKANLFGKFFASTCSLPVLPMGHPLPPLIYQTNQRLSTIDFVPNEVRKLMLKLNPNKASGPDQISYRFLKECADSLSVPLSNFFSLSMRYSYFPEKWKESHLSPVYKKAAEYLKENYRPVSLLSCISKIMGRVVYNGMYNFFKNNGILTQRNSGFKEQDSTINQLIHLCDNIYKGLDDSNDVCLVFLDVSKAFDKVYHRALIHKLESYGIEGDLLHWIESYLDGRRQRVVINGVKSDWNDINASVPQGSILGPLLFLIYVNDLVDELITTPYLFADDTSLFTVIDPIDYEITFNQINRDLQVLAEWARQWRVTYNASKTVYMIVSNKSVSPVYPDLYLNRVKLKKVSSHKHLGVTLTSDMKWGVHIDAAISKANKRLNGIRRIRFLITREARIVLYKALILECLNMLMFCMIIVVSISNRDWKVFNVKLQ